MNQPPAPLASRWRQALLTAPCSTVAWRAQRQKTSLLSTSIVHATLALAADGGRLSTRRMGVGITSMGSGRTGNVSAACVLGLDLAGSPRRPTGFCVLRGRRVHVGHAFSDEDIHGLVESAAPQLVAIDAPLALPAGRCCLLDTCSCA